jgi:hypothetical protein
MKSSGVKGKVVPKEMVWSGEEWRCRLVEESTSCGQANTLSNFFTCKDSVLGVAYQNVALGPNGGDRPSSHPRMDSVSGNFMAWPPVWFKTLQMRFLYARACSGTAPIGKRIQKRRAFPRYLGKKPQSE